MSSPYVGEIRMFGGNFAPAGWAFCAGQLVPISENETLFNLIGTFYGGDGQETFGLPDLQGRLPIHMGTNPGTGTNYVIGEKAGVETVTLNTQQIPVHNHALIATTNTAQQTQATSQVLANSATAMMYFEDTPAVALNASSVVGTGGSQPHDNLQPFLCVSFIISLFGIFPTQS